jgi:hypothetical protein
MKPNPYQFELPGMPVNTLPTQPPVQDSAVVTDLFESDKSRPIFIAKSCRSSFEIIILNYN